MFPGQTEADKNATSTKRTRSYVDEVFRQIQQKPDIQDILILNNLGNPVKTTMEMEAATQFAGLYQSLQDKVVYALKKIDPKDQLLMLRVRTTNNETLITPDEKITVMVVQDAKDQFGDGKPKSQNPRQTDHV